MLFNFGIFLTILASMSSCGGDVLQQDQRSKSDHVSNDKDKTALELFSRPVVAQTSYGPIEGLEKSGVISFKGIPYAAAPKRFELSEPPAPWSETLKANKYGSDCLQKDGESVVGSEDCLFLNVWTPNLQPSKKLPVMVFIHGGSFTSGSGTRFGGLEIYIGDNLAKKSDVVVVTLNYRLGALGFLAHPAMPEINFGIRDQIRAMTWVKNEIEAFGGDANNILLFGESAGAQSVCTHLASPLSAGLFHRATIQSGSCSAYELAEERALSRDDAAKLGCQHSDELHELACLRALPAESFVLAMRTNDQTVDFGRLSYNPIVDGKVLLEQPLDAIKNGRHNKMPVMLGSNKEEVPGIIYIRKNYKTAYENFIDDEFPTNEGSAAIKGYYSKSRFGSYMNALGALHTDFAFTCKLRTMARELTSNQEQQVFRYLYSGGVSFHGSELPFVFQRLGILGGYLQFQMLHYWTKFAKLGKPDFWLTPKWKAYDTIKETTMILSDSSAAVEKYNDVPCNIIDQHE